MIKDKSKLTNKENLQINNENINQMNKIPTKEKLSPREKEMKKDSSAVSNSKDASGSKGQNDSELDKVISNLRGAYQEMKKERVKTEKDTEHLEHKLKMLQTEELNAYKKFQNEKKFKEEWDQARLKTQEFKKFCGDAKSKRETEIKEMSKKIKEMREYIQRSTNVKKMMKFQENRLNSLQLKQQKIENDELRRSLIKEESNKNKRMAESVKLREKNYVEKKKIDGEEKKKNLKKELEAKLMEEQKMKKMFEERLNTLEEKETGLLEKIKTSAVIESADKKYRSLSSGPGSRTKKTDKKTKVKSALKKL